MSKWHVSPASETRVAGYDSEWADMGNPQGAIFVECVFLTATDDRGNRYAGPELGRRCLMSQEYIDAVVAYWQHLFDTNLGEPETSPEWQPSRPAYGSLAYEESGQEQIDALCERRDDPFYLF